MKNFSNEKYNFYLFIQNNMRRVYSPGYLGNIDNVVCFANDEHLSLILKELGINYIVLSIDLAHWFDCIHNFNPDNIYYIGHGIINHYFDESWLTVQYKNWIKLKINLLFCCKTQFKIISKYKKNTYKIGTLPQFENLVKPKAFDKNSSVLVVGGNSLPARQSNYSYEMINYTLSVVSSFYNNNKIFLKPPRGMKSHDPLISRIPNLTVVDERNCLIYDYLNSHVVIVMEGGTVYLEALLSNSKVILVLFPIDWDILLLPEGTDPFYRKEIKEFYNFPKDKYPNLLVSQNASDLHNYLQLTKNHHEYFNSEQYVKDKNQFIKDSIEEYIPDVGKQLIDIIEQKGKPS